MRRSAAATGKSHRIIRRLGNLLGNLYHLRGVNRFQHIHSHAITQHPFTESGGYLGRQNDNWYFFKQQADGGK